MTGLDFGVGRMPWAWFAVAALLLLLLPLVIGTGLVFFGAMNGSCGL